MEHFIRVYDNRLSVEVYPQFADYEKRLEPHVIPVVVLERS